MDEVEALRRLRRGEIDGLEGLVVLYQQRALHVAQLITRDPALAQDAVQDAFIRVYEHFDQYNSTRPFAPWFFKIVANLSLQAVRRNRKTIPLESEAAHSFLAVNIDYESLMAQAETEQQLRSALDSLPAEQRAVLVLRYVIGLSELDTAARLAVPLGTVKWRLFRARERLKKILTFDNRMSAEERLKP